MAMKIQVLKRIAAGLFFLSVAVTLAHAVLLGGALANMLLPYGLPVLTFALAWWALCRAQPLTQRPPQLRPSRAPSAGAR